MDTVSIAFMFLLSVRIILHSFAHLLRSNLWFSLHSLEQTLNEWRDSNQVTFSNRPCEVGYCTFAFAALIASLLGLLTLAHNPLSSPKINLTVTMGQLWCLGKQS